MHILYIIANELMSVFTMWLCFPGIFKMVHDTIDVMCCMFLILCMSIVWPVYILIAPILLLVIFLLDMKDGRNFIDNWK